MRLIKLTRQEPASTDGSFETFVNFELVTEFTGVEGSGTMILFTSVGPDNSRARFCVQENPEDILRMLGTLA